jgi:hypothetical protein
MDLKLTWQGVLEGVEDGYNDVDEDGAHEDDVTPEGHVARHPEEGWTHRFKTFLPEINLPGAQCYKTFSVRNLRIFIIS